MPNKGAAETQISLMNAILPTPTPPPALLPQSTPASDTTPSFLATAREALRKLTRPAKFALIALMLALLVLWYIWTGSVSTDDAQVDAHITAVASQVSGYVVALPVDDNVNVKEGDFLLQIDPREYKAEVDQAKAALDLSRSEANSAELQIGLTRATTTHGTSSAEAQRESDEADYTMSEAQLERTATANLLQAQSEGASKRAVTDRSQSDLERYKPLVQTNDVSKFQFDAVDATARVAQNDLAAAEQQLAAAQQNV